MSKRIVPIILVFLAIRLSTGCATIIHGSSQTMNVVTNPADAEVWVDGMRSGLSPTRLTLSRKEHHLITLRKEGYSDVNVRITKKISGWLLGNILFGGLIGCGVDFISGAAYNLTPDRLDVNLSSVSLLQDRTLEFDAAQLDGVEEIRFLNGNGEPEMVVALSWSE
ncbi:MAG: PEGA domain-containing protein [Bacteroidetes bacterium]|nr:PEGA domain-containing protein [Bacteroidota bacterium]